MVRIALKKVSVIMMSLLVWIFAVCVAGCYLGMIVLSLIFSDTSNVFEHILLVLPFILTAVIYCHKLTMKKVGELQKQIEQLQNNNKADEK